MYNEIKTPHDVAMFFIHIVFEKNAHLDPDTDFHEYVDANGNPSFTDKQADQYEDDMNKSFDVCDEYGVDVYEIASKVMSLYLYCDKQFDLAKLYAKCCD